MKNKLPPPFGVPPSINRGRVELLFKFWEESPAPPLFIEEVAAKLTEEFNLKFKI